MPSFWGAKCDKHSANCVDNNVFYSTGDCVKQCNKGWYGFVDNTRRYPSCDKQCTDTYNEDKCKGCNAFTGKCNVNAG